MYLDWFDEKKEQWYDENNRLLKGGWNKKNDFSGFFVYNIASRSFWTCLCRNSTQRYEA